MILAISITHGRFSLLLLQKTQGAQRQVFPIYLSFLKKSNVDICPAACPLVIYKFFGYVNEFDSHNKSRQYYLALEKFWVTQYGWLRLCTTVAMGMTITNFWKLFYYGVKRDHYDKSIGIR